LEPKDRIADLCNRATAENDPAALKKILDELKAALAEYIRQARRMTLLHFDYFRKHQEFPSEGKPLETLEGIEQSRVTEDVKDVKEDLKKRAS